MASAFIVEGNAQKAREANAGAPFSFKGGRVGAKAASSFSSISAAMAAIGSSWSLCHSICLALIAALAGIGIIITGMPFLFLFEYNTYFWGAAVLLLIPSAAMYLKNPKCFSSSNLIIFNLGVIIAGIPPNIAGLQPYSWIAGGAVAAVALIRFLLKKIKSRGVKNG